MRKQKQTKAREHFALASMPKTKLKPKPMLRPMMMAIVGAHLMRLLRKADAAALSLSAISRTCEAFL